MQNNNQTYAAPKGSLQRFQQKVEQLRGQSRTFTALVRALYLTIEQGIQDDVPLELLLATINEEHSTVGTMSGFKSALYRVRKEVEARRILGFVLDPNVALFPGNANPAAGMPPYVAPGQQQFFPPAQFVVQQDPMNTVPIGQPTSQWPTLPTGTMHAPYGTPPHWAMPQQQGGYHRPMC